MMREEFNLRRCECPEDKWKPINILTGYKLPFKINRDDLMIEYGSDEPIYEPFIQCLGCRIIFPKESEKKPIEKLIYLLPDGNPLLEINNLIKKMNEIIDRLNEMEK